MSNRDIALSLAAIGWHVFPVSQEGKPLVKWSQVATTDPATIQRWFNKDERVGVHTGLSGLVVVDRDNKHGKNGFNSLKASRKPLPVTFGYTSRSGKGKHDLYAAPQGIDCTIAANVHDMQGVDIRAGVGMIVYNGPALVEPPVLAPAPAWTIIPRTDSYDPADLQAWLDEERSPHISQNTLELIKAIPLHGAGDSDLLQLITPVVSSLMWGNGRKRGYKFSLERYTKHYPTSRESFKQAWSKAITRVDAEVAEVLSERPALTPAPGIKIHRKIVHTAPELKGAGTRLTFGEVTMASTEQVEMNSAQWLWGSEQQGGIPLGALTIITGKPGDGKSTMCRWLASCITQGTLPGTFAGTPQNVLYLHAEESLGHVVVPSLVANGADRKRSLILTSQLDPSTDMDDLVNVCLQAGVKAVFVDPLTSYMSGVDTHRNSEVRDALKGWSRLAEAIDGAVIGIVHQTKSGGSDFVTGINGSSAFGEVARAVLATAVDAADETRVVSQGKNSLGPLMQSREFTLDIVGVPVDGGGVKHMPAFRLGDVTSRSAGEVFNRNKKLDRGESQTAKTWLRDYLEVNPGAFKEDILEAAKGLYAPRSLGRASKDLKVKSTFVNRKVCWSLE